MKSKSDNVRIIQLLCPNRHCILAVAFDPKLDSEESVLKEFKSTVQKSISDGGIHGHCDICRIKKDRWQYEVGVTRFATIDQAKPHMLAMQKAQHETRKAIARMRAEQN